MKNERCKHWKRSVLDQESDFGFIEWLGRISDGERWEGDDGKRLVDCVDGDGGKRVVKLNQREAVRQSVGAEREHREDSYKAIAAAIRIAICRRAAFPVFVLTLSKLRDILYPVARDQRLSTLLVLGCEVKVEVSRWPRPDTIMQGTVGRARGCMPKLCALLRTSIAIVIPKSAMETVSEKPKRGRKPLFVVLSLAVL